MLLAWFIEQQLGEPWWKVHDVCDRIDCSCKDSLAAWMDVVLQHIALLNLLFNSIGVFCLCDLRYLLGWATNHSGSLLTPCTVWARRFIKLIGLRHTLETFLEFVSSSYMRRQFHVILCFSNSLVICDHQINEMLHNDTVSVHQFAFCSVSYLQKFWVLSLIHWSLSIDIHVFRYLYKFICISYWIIWVSNNLTLELSSMKYFSTYFLSDCPLFLLLLELFSQG